MPSTIYTIGHSSHTFDKLAALLRSYEIEVVVDVRSRPYSKHAPHFTKRPLEQALRAKGLSYRFAGERLGGMGIDARRAEAPDFIAAIDELIAASKQQRLVLLCAEEDPDRCHRHHLVGHALTSRGIVVSHIRADGRLDAQLELLGAGPEF